MTTVPTTAKDVTVRVPYAEVAQEYLAAADRGVPPTTAVAHRWAIPHTTAARWVARARSRGLLPPTTKGVASLPTHRPAPAVIRGSDIRWTVCRTCLTAWPCESAPALLNAAALLDLTDVAARRPAAS